MAISQLRLLHLAQVQLEIELEKKAQEIKELDKELRWLESLVPPDSEVQWISPRIVRLADALIPQLEQEYIEIRNEIADVIYQRELEIDKIYKID
jgi:hypothetical protein